MADKVLIGDTPPEGKHRMVSMDAMSPWSLLIVAGIAIAIIGWVDVLLTFVPPNWASLEWEIGTVTAVFDALPLGTLGLTLITAGLVAKSARQWVMATAITCAGLTLLLMLLAGILALDVPPALRSVNPQVAFLLKKSLLKTGFMSVVYIALYAVMAWWLWRLSRVTKGAGTR